MKLVIDMIYLNNNSDVQQVYIPRETLNIKKVSPIPDDQFSDYYTKSEVDNLIDGVEVDLSDYYTKTEVDGIVDGVEVDLSDYYTKTEVNGIVDNIDLTGYATETWVEGKDYVQKTNLATVNGQTLYNGGDIVIEGGGSGVDLSDYYTKTEVDTLIDGVEVDLTDYYTKSEVDGYISENTKDITTNTNSIQTINTVTLPDISSKIKTNTDDISDLARKLEEDYYTKEDLTTDLARLSELENDFNVLEQQTLPNDRAVVSALQTRVETIETNYVDKNGLKTINGKSIIGEGNIVIDGSGVIEGDYVEYNEFAEVAAQVTTNQGNIQNQEGRVSALESRMGTVEQNYVDKNGLKTINGKSIVGEGNIVIDGSGVEGDYVEYNEFVEVAAQVTTNQGNIQNQSLRVEALESRMGTVEQNYVQKTNLATVNGQTLYNGGNIVIEGGGLVGEVVSSTEPTDAFPQVLYVEQTLTDEQKGVARRNIGIDTYVDNAIANAITNTLNTEV